MDKFKRLFRKAWTAITNPGESDRVPLVLAEISREFREKRQAFDLEQLLAPIDCTYRDVEIAAEQYYTKLLRQYWTVGVPSESQLRTLAFVARKLEIKPEKSKTLNANAAVTYFGTLLGTVLEDGFVTDTEWTQLASVASSIGMTVQQFMTRHMLDQGVGLLRAVFAKATSNGRLNPAIWNNLLQSADRLGIPSTQLRDAAIPLAKSFAEHVLADTKSDGVLSGEEEEYIRWLIRTFDFGQDFNRYLSDEIDLLRERTQLASGNLPTVPVPPGINLHAGELLYLVRPSVLHIPKRRKDGLHYDEHVGRLLLTDNRLLFDSSTKPVTIKYRSIVAWETSDKSISVTVANKPQLQFLLPLTAERLLAEKFDALIKLHSQLLRRQVEGTPNRYIPRTVRQRVWQQYGGKCADCGATEYLEFDHIVPVAKGGSNSEQNVQLLCRNCNLKKSDAI